MVICKDTAVGVFAFPKVKHTVKALLPLDYKTVCLPFPFLNKNGGQFKLNAAQSLHLPPSERKDVIVERTAAVSAKTKAAKNMQNRKKTSSNTAQTAQTLSIHSTSAARNFRSTILSASRYQAFHDPIRLGKS